MPDQALMVMIAAVMLPGILYLRLAVRESAAISTVHDFLPLKRYLSSRSVSATVVAAGMSMATVMVALVNLAPLIGSALFVTILTFAIGFCFLAAAVPRILEANPRNLVLQAYLAEAFGSRAVGVVATLFTVVGYLSIFAMELLVGTSILEPVLGSWTLAFATIYLLFLLVYSALSGYRGVVATDRWQLLFIILAVAALVAFVIWNYSTHGLQSSFDGVTISGLLEWKAPLAFVVGIAVMNIPAPLADTGTWQRVCSAESPAAARSGIRSALVLFVIIWTTLIVVGCLHPTLRGLDDVWPADGSPLMVGIIESISQPNNPILLAILFLLILGLFSAMISTADSLLLAAGQAALTGSGNAGWIEEDPQAALRKCRLWIVGLAIGSFAVFMVFHIMSFNVVQLVFAIYGAQLALGPTTLVTLVFRDREFIRSLRSWAIVSITTGFASAWACAIHGHMTGSMDLQFYAPAVGLGVASLVMVSAILVRTGRGHPG